ncbi:MAG: hypothetical protein L6R40_002489 [Gallowayella cf. fulva]|nr:MAG: hypothetical protein L6R40_002489 [Xanthomendoza cf. fulva]
MAILVTYIFIHSLLGIIDQLTRATTHLKKQPQIGCNGREEFCNRKYSNITHIATHDAPFIGVLPTENQNVDIPAQLDAGVRFLQAQTHRNAFGKLSLCHTQCVMKDAGLLTDYLKVIKEWLDKHPKEVVTILLTNGDRLHIDEFDNAFRKSGIVPYAYAARGDPNKWSLDSWPTLGQLIANHTRVIAFLDTGADQIRVPYLHNEFSYFWETPFDTLDPSFPSCKIDRPVGLEKFPDAWKRRMYIVNHFLDTKIGGVQVPDRRDAAKTNAWMGKSSIGAHAGRCAALYGRAPAAVLVDYVDKGEGFMAQDILNGF